MHPRLPQHFVGVDGCKAGWIAVASRGDEAASGLDVRVFSTFRALHEAFSEQAVIAVDIPIGLLDWTGPDGRGPEALIRARLDARRSSVFSVPSRAAVFMECDAFADNRARLAAHKRASMKARETSDPPIGISIQAFGLFPKIREVDEMLRLNPDLAECVYESHPEFAFAVLNDGVAMRFGKKIRSRVNLHGMEERANVLARWGVSTAILNEKAPKGAGQDDLYDAIALMLVARRIARGSARAFPSPPRIDRHGLRIAIWA